MLLVTICALNDEVLAKIFKKYKKYLSLIGCLVNTFDRAGTSSHAEKRLKSAHFKIRAPS